MSTQIALLVPALFAAGGLTLFVGVQAAILGSIGHRAQVCMAFAATCLAASGFIFATAALHASWTIDDAVAALRWQMVFAMLFMPVFVLFVGEYTGMPPAHLRRGVLMALLVATVLLVANASLPAGIRYRGLSVGSPLRLPWGEVIPVFNGTLTGWSYVARIFAAGIFAWAACRAGALHRMGQHRRALMLLSYLALQVCSMAHGLLVDVGAIRSIYLPSFAFLALALIMSTSFAMDLRDQGESLRRRSRELRAEMSRREDAERALLDRAYRDESTGLPNRARLHELLAAQREAVNATGRCGMILLLDLNQVRATNDALGHDVGDQVLVELAACLGRPYAHEATLFRSGGSEFALVLTRLVDRKAARLQAERLVAEVTRRLEAPSSLGFLANASIGIACIDSDCESGMDPLRRAEMALYEARAGRGQVAFFEPGMQERAHARMRLMRGLRGAQERGELSLEFQPQCDSLGAVRGAEALMRWTHAEHGQVPPDQFIALAEESGLIHSLGQWALDGACAALARWKREGLSLRGRLSVNISGWQLAHPGFVAMVRATLARHGVDPADLALEVTETVLLVDAEDSIARLAQLRADGLRISMDDFGTGFSSLAQLHRVPLDEIKIDKSFVDGMLRNERVKLLVETIVSAGHHLQLAVVAEGVETREQHLMLVDAGCDVFQGYLYGRAMPEAVFRDWLVVQARVQESVLRFRGKERTMAPPEAEASTASAPGVAAIAYFGA
jgi:diguanylate cyclase (GGDEF)-like protein